MKVKFFLISLFSVLLFLKTSYATTYFDFELDRNIVSAKNVIVVSFLSDLQGLNEADFLVKPVFDKGSVYLFDDTSNNWILSEDVWTKMPVLSRKMKLKIAGFDADRGDLKFKLLCKKTSVTYETPERKLWNESIYTGYTSKLNENVLNPESSASVVSSYTKRPAIINSIKNRIDSFIDMVRKMLKYG
jgi:hypothetical protein